MSETAPEHLQQTITSNLVAPQHGPRPLPLFLAHLWQETAHDPELRQAALRGLRKYQHAARIALRRDHELQARSGEAKLLHVAGAAAAHKNGHERTAIILIPSLVNSHVILDLSESMSLARYLSGEGHDVWLVDWGTPAPEDADLGLGGHIETRLVPLIESLNRPVTLIGYCLGGTLALGAAAMLNPAAVVTIAAPWNFDGYSVTDREQVAALWRQAKPLCEQLGHVPMEVLQNGFWSLDPSRTVRKYAAFADMEAGSDAERAFLAVEDWANEGAPLTLGVGIDLFERLHAGNESGTGRWTVGGRAVRPEDIACPALAIRSTTDRIVPAAAAPSLRDRIDSPLGHVGMIVGRRAPEQIWRPLSDWLSNHHL